MMYVGEFTSKANQEVHLYETETGEYTENIKPMKQYGCMDFSEMAQKVITTSHYWGELQHDISIHWYTTRRGNKKIEISNRNRYEHGSYNSIKFTNAKERLHLTNYKIGKAYGEIFATQLIGVERELLYRRVFDKFGCEEVPAELLARGLKLGITDEYDKMDSKDCQFWTEELNLLNKEAD